MDECVVSLLIDLVILTLIYDRVIPSRTLHSSVQPRIMSPPDDDEQPLEPAPSGSGSNATTKTTAMMITVDAREDDSFMPPSTTPPVERPLRSPTPTHDLPPREKIPLNRSDKTSTTDPPHSGTDLSSEPGKRPAVPATATSPYSSKVFAGRVPVQRSIRSGTSSSQLNSSRIFGSASWSEQTEVDLVANLGSQERTRQEFLFEIVSSEER